jgi:dTDP-4-dehydrorhamnose 3,5-epimerase
MSDMLFTSTGLEGAFLIDIERREDDRGFFARTWCRHELATRGLDTEVAQESIWYNRLA